MFMGVITSPLSDDDDDEVRWHVYLELKLELESKLEVITAGKSFFEILDF